MRAQNPFILEDEDEIEEVSLGLLRLSDKSQFDSRDAVSLADYSKIENAERESGKDWYISTVTPFSWKVNSEEWMQRDRKSVV